MMCTAPVEALAHPDIRSDLIDLITRVDAQLEKRIKDAIREGGLSASVDPRMAAKMAQGLLHSLALRARAGESKSSLKKLARYTVGVFTALMNHGEHVATRR